MLISDRHRFIFIHNPKCAGTSIFKALLPYSNFMCRFAKAEGHRMAQVNYYIRKIFGESRLLSSFSYHITASELRNAVGEKNWNSYYSFAVVRNPYQRLLSNYHFISRRENHALREYYLERPTFRDYVLKIESMPWHDFQHHYLTDQGKIMVKKVIRFEELESGFSEVLKEIGLPEIRLGKVNVIGTEKDFLSQYDDEMIRIVNRVYDEDFRIFNYQKIQVT